MWAIGSPFSQPNLFRPKAYPMALQRFGFAKKNGQRGPATPKRCWRSSCCWSTSCMGKAIMLYRGLGMLTNIRGSIALLLGSNLSNFVVTMPLYDSPAISKEERKIWIRTR
jgi:hypothetical protein